jgi:hypothetical protein
MLTDFNISLEPSMYSNVLGLCEKMQRTTFQVVSIGCIFSRAAPLEAIFRDTQVVVYI